MTAQRFHLGWFMNFTLMNGERHSAMAAPPGMASSTSRWPQTLERACFDYIMIEDKLMVPQALGGTPELSLRERDDGSET